MLKQFLILRDFSSFEDSDSSKMLIPYNANSIAVIGKICKDGHPVIRPTFDFSSTRQKLTSKSVLLSY